MHALVVADGDIPSRSVVERLLGSPPQLVVAADGGALKSAALGYPPQVVVGDADSLPAGSVERLRGEGAEVILHPPAKDQSDTELALLQALDRGATDILVVGAFGGGRLEHTLANLLLLCLAEIGERNVRLADAGELRLARPSGRDGQCRR